ncbi:MAG: hypothetical protein R6W31_07970 [Bacteroidales bacterium]
MGDLKGVNRIRGSYGWTRFTPLWLLLVLPFSCSHSYDSDTLDLWRYQWNMWPDIDAEAGPDSLYSAPVTIDRLPVHAPSCGWEVLHRGNGKLVRIPATLASSFSREEQSSVTWFHCRHTLPELWAGRDISLSFEGVSHRAEIYLNEALVGAYLGENRPFTIDITDVVYYKRDNHLAIRVYDPLPDSCGITGKILVVSKPSDH